MVGKKFHLATILLILLQFGETPKVEAVGPISVMAASACIVACCGSACAAVAPACEYYSENI